MAIQTLGAQLLWTGMAYMCLVVVIGNTVAVNAPLYSLQQRQQCHQRRQPPPRQQQHLHQKVTEIKGFHTKFFFLYSPDCAEKDTIPVLRTIAKLKKVKTVSDCSKKCLQNPDCDYYKWKVTQTQSKSISKFIHFNVSDPQEGKQEAVSLDADPIHSKEELVVRTKKLLKCFIVLFMISQRLNLYEIY